MKQLVIVCFLFLTACSTRHVSNNTFWYADCYIKKEQEAMIAQSEALLSPNDFEKRRTLRRAYWNLQKECK
jgi:hypothetical protein